MEREVSGDKRKDSFYKKRKRVERAVSDSYTEQNLSNKVKLAKEYRESAFEKNATCAGNQVETEVHLQNKNDTLFTSMPSTPSFSFDPATFQTTKELEEDEYWRPLCSDKEETDDEEENDLNVAEFLRGWAVENQGVTHVALSELLKGLKNFFPELPSDARTLLKTPKNITVAKMGTGYFHHFGAEKPIREKLKNMNCNVEKIELNISVEGLPLNRSNKMQFWPILMSIEEDPPKKPFEVSLFCGTSKSPLHHFFDECLEELSQFYINGFPFNGTLLPFSIRAIICDAPARAFVKAIKQFNARSGCDRCIQEGEWKGCMTFKLTNAKLRTDSTFRNKEHPDHHQPEQECPFCKLPIDMIAVFTQDYMHLICLGNTRKLALIWTGKRGLRGKQSADSILNLNSLLVEAKKTWSREFNREPRTLAELDYWKATEYRQFLLYLGPVLLKNILNTEQYKHFLLLSCATSILITPELCQTKNNKAKKLMKKYIEESPELYGENFQVYNVHSLMHICDDVMRLGPLDTFSAFSFENHLQKLKKQAKQKSNHHLQQAVRRIEERRLYEETQPKEALERIPDVQVSRQCYEKLRPTAGIRGDSYSKLSTPNFELSTTPKNCHIELQDKTMAKISNFIKDDNGNIHIIAHIYTRSAPFFTYPKAYRLFNILRISNLSVQFHRFSVTDIKSKVLVLPYKNELVGFPMLHFQDT